MKILRLFIIVVLSVFSVSGCRDWFGSGTGLIEVNISLPSRAAKFATLSPELQISGYGLDFISYNGESSEKADVYLAEGHGSLTLAVGEWEICFYAENLEGIRIAERTVSGISVDPAVSNTVNAVLEPVAGTGALSVSLDLSEKPESVTVSTVSYTLTKGIAPPVIIEAGELLSPYELEITGCESGTDYILRFEIQTDSSTVVSEGVVHVFSDIETSDTVYITAADFWSSNVIIADHTAVERYSSIPEEWKTEVKKMLLIIGGESHGRAYNYGLELLETQDASFAVSVQWSGEPESYTDQYLRSTRSYRFGGFWSDSMGEEDCFTNQTAIDNIKTGLTYTADTYTDTVANAMIIQGFGWCWDMTWINAPGGIEDPDYGVRWAGSTVGGPDGNLRWGLDAADTTLTGNSVSMQTYLDAVTEFNNHEPDILFLYTTGPVDTYFDENGYQRYLKHEYIREYVESNGGVLLDYADILSWHYDADQYEMASWNGHTFPTGNPSLATGGDGYNNVEGGCHISSDGCIQLAKALWWMLARVAGWDGN